MRLTRTALLLLALAACDRAPTAPATDLLATASVSASTVRAGATVSVQIAVTNNTSTVKVVNVFQGYCGLAYEVLKPDGTNMNLGANEPCPLMLLAPPVIEPGATYTITQQWSTQDFPLPAGSYVVRAALKGTGVESVPTGIQITP